MSSAKFTQLKSSNLDGCYYDPATKTLMIKFKSGTMYHYEGCSQEHCDNLCKAESAGKYFSKSIKPHFKWKKA